MLVWRSMWSSATGTAVGSGLDLQRSCSNFITRSTVRRGRSCLKRLAGRLAPDHKVCDRNRPDASIECFGTADVIAGFDAPELLNDVFICIDSYATVPPYWASQLGLLLGARG